MKISKFIRLGEIIMSKSLKNKITSDVRCVVHHVRYEISKQVQCLVDFEVHNQVWNQVVIPLSTAFSLQRLLLRQLIWNKVYYDDFLHKVEKITFQHQASRLGDDNE